MERLVDYCNADLEFAFLRDGGFRGKNFRGARLLVADFRRSDLRDADLRDANLRDACFQCTNLEGANLRGANLMGARFEGARLRRTIMPDGRVWEEYRQDPLKGICRTPEARERAIKAWGSHVWGYCPMSGANGYRDREDVPKEDLLLVAAFIAVYDAWLLSKPE